MKKRENFEDSVSTCPKQIYGEFPDDKIPEVPKDSLWAKVAKEGDFKATAAVTRSEITPEHCRLFSKTYNNLEMGDPEADDQLGTARMECLMKYGEFSPSTGEGVDQYEPNVDQAFWTGHPTPL
jgi:hypothetical protein